ncbi:TetR/AcrR family transcriptional regulator [Jidongwangia harbinensis]|uniref:TetR/AcrR family transcriptional regulator n=1 Tax=Jidongwangia harbinensis TaxID=2878561 RepID=UPI001CD9DEA6|nr:TetR/AcrR family transcriptional regulator [Jidongwangia harbinensis]MCA2218485.1 TetR/AcrR family transcriptional regulator [Jidongwangia harbinensis]
MDDKRRLILDQALALVDEHGLAAMSMRAVAERVGLTSMALYPYVGGKDALLDGLVDLLGIELGSAYGDDPADIDWRQRLRALGRAVRKLAHEHPGAFPLLLNRPAAAASASWLTAALRGVLHDAGAAPDQVPRMARMICAFLLGYTTGEVTGGLPPGTRPAEEGDGGAEAVPEGGDDAGDPAGGPDADARQSAGAAEFDADLEDLVRLVEVAVRVG